MVKTIDNRGSQSPYVLKTDFFDSLNQMQTGIAIYDKDLINLTFANTAIRGYLPHLYASLDAGLSIREGIAAQIYYIFPDLKDHEREARADYIYNKIKNSGKMEVTTPAGLTLSSTYDKTPEGSYIVSCMDVTERVRNEAQLAKARADSEAANRAKTEFLANMSHEIRTPLSGVSMAAQLLQQQLRATNQTELAGLADILAESANHLSAIINDVLDLSKIEAGQIELDLSENSFSDMIRIFKKSQDYVAAERGVGLKLVVDAKLPERLVYDKVRVRQCVTNLVSNALKFTTTGSVTIAVLFNPETYAVTVHVVDTGIGIAVSEQASVFDHFAQAKQDVETAHMGTGLGLSISRKLARLMGGDIKLTSELGKGSAFTLSFASKPVVPLTASLIHAA